MFEGRADAVWLVTGAHQLRSALQRPAEWQLGLVECPAAAFIPQVDGGQSYTVAIADCPSAQVLRLDRSGSVLGRSTGSLADLLGKTGTVPLGLLRPAGAGTVQPYLHVDSYAGHVRFLKLPAEPVPPAAAPAALLAGLDQHYLKVNNYLCFRVKLRPDIELEHKFTLTGDPDVYLLAQDTLRHAAAGGLAGWIVEFREEIQQWDFLNHVYAISEPAEQAGYVSFIPTTDGRYTVKRKLFTADTDERPETRTRGVRIDTDLATHVRNVLGLTPDWHASFRRIRYDVSVEAIGSGNVFGIAYDRCTVIDQDGQRIPGMPELLQCELEYIYCQALTGADYASVRADLASLRMVLGDWFDQRGIENYQRHESKLTFLRNLHVAAG
ncbi:MAG TPA: hypothetical protein VFU36_07430 [Jatrophihabitans sp.]|nr:hypothetical protein [Jatrophihabitans sp.]